MRSKRSFDNTIFSQNVARENQNIELSGINWYIFYYTSSVTQQVLLNQQSVTKMPTEKPWKKDLFV